MTEHYFEVAQHCGFDGNEHHQEFCSSHDAERSMLSTLKCSQPEAGERGKKSSCSSMERWDRITDEDRVGDMLGESSFQNK